MKKCIILANGYPIKKNIITQLSNIGFHNLICADGGANTAYKLKLKPDLIIGDLDSISAHVLKYYKNDTKVLRIIRQNDTDVEKALKYVIQNKYTETVITGVAGDRLDHLFCNLGISFKYSDKIKIRILYEKSILDVYKGEVEIVCFPGETISIYGIDKNTRITSFGLKYNLKNTSLPFGVRESTSNIALSEKIKLEIKKGKIFVIRNYDVLRKNGLL